MQLQHPSEIQNLKNQLNDKESNNTNSVRDFQIKISELEKQISDFRNLEIEYQNVRSQAQHADTFRNELQKARNEIDDLNKKIDYLQLTPAKRKKIDVLNNKSENTLLSSTDTKDGGSF